MTRSRSLAPRVLVAIALAAGLAAALLAFLRLEPPELLEVGTAYTAKIVCSSVFLEGRDAQEVLREDVQAPGSILLRLMHVSVDRSAGVVRAAFLGFIADGLAVARPGEGCAVLPDGKLESVRHAGLDPAPPAPAPFTRAPPAPAPPALAASAAPWPDGEGVLANDALGQVLADSALTGPGLRAVLVILHGRLVAERYGGGFDAHQRQLGWSMTKSVTAALIGLLVKDRRLSLAQRALWPAGDARAAITVADLLSMTSGLRFDESYGAVSDATRMLFLEGDMAAYARAQPLEHPVGTVWSYSSGTAVILARLFQDTAGPDALALVRDRLFAPLGMSSALIETDRHGTMVGSSYMYATPRDWARFGQFLLQQGVWHGTQILPPGFVAMMATPVAASHNRYGHGMLWLSVDEARASAGGLPADTFWMTGHDGQYLAIIPSRELVVVRLGLTPRREHYQPEPLVEALLHALPQGPAG